MKMKITIGAIVLFANHNVLAFPHTYTPKSYYTLGKKYDISSVEEAEVNIDDKTILKETNFGSSGATNDYLSSLVQNNHQPTTPLDTYNNQSYLPSIDDKNGNDSVAVPGVTAIQTVLNNKKNRSKTEYSSLPPPASTLKNIYSREEIVSKSAPQTVTLKPKQQRSSAHQVGMFSPVVTAAKRVVGENKVNNIRGKFITYHSNVIKDVVGNVSAENPIGNNILRQLFRLADKNGDGTLSKEELKTVFTQLGFDWLQDKQIDGIMQRADKNGDGEIDVEEFIQEAPNTFKMNLVKLAKKNGNSMGLLV